MNFSDYISDILGLNESLMSSEDRKSALASFTAWNKNSESRRNWKAGEKTLEARAVARLFGGKALTGSAKQKVWGEKIRAEKIRGMTEQQAAMACDPSGLGRSAHFWIDNRSKSAKDIGEFFVSQKAALAEALALRQSGKADEYAAAAEAYNQLTEAWGFTS